MPYASTHRSGHLVFALSHGLGEIERNKGLCKPPAFDSYRSIGSMQIHPCIVELTRHGKERQRSHHVGFQALSTHPCISMIASGGNHEQFRTVRTCSSPMHHHSCKHSLPSHIRQGPCVISRVHGRNHGFWITRTIFQYQFVQQLHPWY